MDVRILPGCGVRTASFANGAARLCAGCIGTGGLRLYVRVHQVQCQQRGDPSVHTAVITVD